MPEPVHNTHLQQCLQLSTEFSSEYLHEFIEHAGEGLFKLADQAANNQQQQLYFDSREKLRNLNALDNRFKQHLEQTFDAFVHNRETVSDDLQSSKQTSLSLVQDDALEESLALHSMGQKQESILAEAIYSLNQRLAIINRGRKIEPHYSPVEPAVFADALQQSLAEGEFSTKIKLLLYKWFDKYFMRHLYKLYQQLNEYLRQAGVLPNLSYHIERRPSSGTQSDSPKASSTATASNIEQIRNQAKSNRQQAENIAISSSQAIQQQLLQKILALQASHRPAGASTNYDAGSSLSHDELTKALSRIQQQQSQGFSHPPDKHQLTPVAVAQAEQLKQLQSENDDKRINRLDQEVINLVGMVFNYMLSDSNLTDKAKALLSYLHTPFLKLALVEKDFFEHPQHPARQLLNQLAEAGSRWLLDDQGKNNLIYQQMHSVVQQVLNHQGNDSAIFAQLAFEFSAFLREHKRRIQRTEERATQVAKGEDRLLEIKQKVEHILVKKSKHLRLPKPIETLLFEPWANYMQFTILRYGAKSDELRQALLTAEDILNFITPKHNRVEKQQAEAMTEGLFKRIQHGFDIVGYQQDKGQQLIKSLELCQQLSSADIMANDDEIAAAEARLISQSDSISDELKPYLAQLKDLEFGSWFVFKNQSPSEIAKLAWFNERTNHYMFVNKIGQQTKVCTSSELARLLADKKLELLPDGFNRPFFEKALESIADQMQDNK